MAEGGPRPESRKWGEILEQNIAVVAIGLVAIGGAGALGGYVWLGNFVDGRVSNALAQVGPLPDAIGAVVAFKGECPVALGWIRYNEANSRFIIGAASADDLSAGPAGFRNGSNGQPLSPRSAGEPGGTENVELEPDNLPSHGHRISTDRVADRSIHDGLAGYPHQEGQDRGILKIFQEISNKPGWDAVLPDVLEKTGEGKPHYNMPPYLPLYFCVRVD